jgi:hypothetical protein
VPLDQLGDLRDGREPAVRRPPEPAGEEPTGGAQVPGVPEGAEALLERPGPGDLEILPLQRPQGPSLGWAHVPGAHQPEVLRAGEPVIVLLAEAPLLRPPHLVDCVMEVLHDVELVEHDLGRGVGEMRLGRLHVRLPHVHGDRGDAAALGRGQGGPEAVQALPLPVVGQIEHAAAVEIGHDRQVAMPRGDRLFVHAEVGHGLGLPPRQAATHRPPLDPPGRIPGDPQETTGALHRALPQEVHGQPLEQGGERRARLGPGDPDLLDAVGEALDPRHVALDPGREPTGVPVAPAPWLAVVAGRGRPALRTTKRARTGVDLHDHLLALHVQVHGRYRPRRCDAQDRPVELDVAHGSDPPFVGSEDRPNGSQTHRIS